MSNSGISTKSKRASVQQEMMADKAGDALENLYQDIADHFKPSHFRFDHFDLDKKSSRHQRLKITGFRILIPVGKKVTKEE